MTIPLPNNRWAEVTYSRDDGGWYAVVFGRDGKDIAVIPPEGVLDTERDAVQALDAWLTTWEAAE